MKTIDLSSISTTERYKTLIALITPRPIALVSTVNNAGVGNLAPFSFFNAVSSNPPTVMISIAWQDDGGQKDTLVNINETGEFVVNLVSSAMIEKVVGCAAKYPYGVNELSAVGLTPITSVKVRPNRVAESPAHLECRVSNTIQIGPAGSEGATTVFFGEVLCVHIADNVIASGRIDPRELDLVGRLGGISYTKLGEILNISVPKI